MIRFEPFHRNCEIFIHHKGDLPFDLSYFRLSGWWQHPSPQHPAHRCAPWWQGQHHQPGLDALHQQTGEQGVGGRDVYNGGVCWDHHVTSRTLHRAYDSPLPSLPTPELSPDSLVFLFPTIHHFLKETSREKKYLPHVKREGKNVTSTFEHFWLYDFYTVLSTHHKSCYHFCI